MDQEEDDEVIQGPVVAPPAEEADVAGMEIEQVEHIIVQMNEDDRFDTDSDDDDDDDMCRSSNGNSEEEMIEEEEMGVVEVRVPVEDVEEGFGVFECDFAGERRGDVIGGADEVDQVGCHNAEDFLGAFPVDDEDFQEECLALDEIFAKECPVGDNAVQWEESNNRDEVLVERKEDAGGISQDEGSLHPFELPEVCVSQRVENRNYI
jgi:hypothetical protein